TPAAAAAANTRALPTAFTCQVSSGSWLGWKSQARWTTASAPASTGSSASVATSAATNRPGAGRSTAGCRRATATTSVTSGRRVSSSTTLVPTLPVAPTTTMRTGRSYPGDGAGNRPCRGSAGRSGQPGDRALVVVLEDGPDVVEGEPGGVVDERLDQLLAHGPGQPPGRLDPVPEVDDRPVVGGLDQQAVLDGAVAVERQDADGGPPLRHVGVDQLALDGDAHAEHLQLGPQAAPDPGLDVVDGLDREQHTAPVRHGPRVEDVGGDDVDRSADQGGRMVGHHGARRYTLAGRAHRVSGHPPAPGATGAG